VRGRPRVVVAEAAGAALGIAPGWDRRPGALGLVVLREPRTGARVLGEMRWGLAPGGGGGGGGRAARLTHARAETIAASPAFRDALRARRFCLVPMDGYVQRASRGAAAGQPFAVARADGAPMAVAGLWDEPDEGAAAYAVVTCAANAALAPIHDRMPVVLAPEAWPTWLARQAVPLEAALALLRPCPAAWLRVRPLGPAEVARPLRPARPARVGRPAEQMRLLGLAEPAPAAASHHRGPRAAAERQRPMARRASQ
jgi:putative SOS response-associated peptidase YedK